MIGYYLSSNNEICYSIKTQNFSPTKPVRDDSGGIRVARQAVWSHLGRDGIFVLDNLELVAAKELIFLLKRSHQFCRCLLMKCRAAVLGEGASTLSRASMLQRFGWNHRNTPIKYIFMF